MASRRYQIAANQHRRSLDFTEDCLPRQRAEVRRANLKDDCTRECPIIKGDLSLPGSRVVGMLEDVAGKRGYPDMLFYFFFFFLKKIIIVARRSPPSTRRDDLRQRAPQRGLGDAPPAAALGIAQHHQLPAPQDEADQQRVGLGPRWARRWPQPLGEQRHTRASSRSVLSEKAGGAGEVADLARMGHCHRDARAPQRRDQSTLQPAASRALAPGLLRRRSRGSGWP